MKGSNQNPLAKAPDILNLQSTVNATLPHETYPHTDGIAISLQDLKCYIIRHIAEMAMTWYPRINRENCLS